MSLNEWPRLAYDEWKDTLHAVHMWTQIVGKIRLATTPLLNHWWNSSLAVTPRGLTTGTMPSGADAFRIDLDFIEYELATGTSRGGRMTMPLREMSVAQFYRDVLDVLSGLLVCGRCGSSMSGQTRKADRSHPEERASYVCYARRVAPHATQRQSCKTSSSVTSTTSSRWSRSLRLR